MRPGAREDALHLVVLWAFAVAQPLYDLLGRNPTYFVFHRSQAVDLLLFVAAVSLVSPLLLAAFVSLAGAVLPGRWRGLPAALTVAGLAAALVFPVLRLALGLPPAAALAAGLAAGGALAWLRARSEGSRRFLSFLAPVALLFPLLFLMRPGIRAQWLPAAVSEGGVAGQASETPVLMVIFDALPVASLLDEDGAIDPVRYPNFARLAGISDGYRRATTVANSTEYAVPAMLTGQCPDLGHPAPVFAAHPRNLFTWLGPGRRLEVSETVTSLCPQSLCGAERIGLLDRTRALWRDSAFVYLHRLLPRPWARGIPRVDTTWGGFGGGAVGDARRERAKKPGQIERFRASLARLEATPQPLLYFAHLGVPHEPYLFLPSGQRYREGEEPSGTTATFGEDPLVPLHSLQRHLLQVGLADRLLGELLDRLEATGLLDRSLLVVTSDHGTAFQPSLPRRDVEPGNAAEVLAVPLWVKRPGQRRGRALDTPVQTVDILPSIAAELGVPPLDGVDGRAFTDVELEGSLSCPAGRTALPEVTASGVAEAAERTRALFAVDPVFPTVAVRSELLGRPVAAHLCPEAGDLDLRIEHAERFEAVDPRGEFVPAEVVGSAFGQPDGREVRVAVAVNGTVRATTRTYRLGDGSSTLWSAIVPPTAFVPGANHVEALEIVERARCALRRAEGTASAPLVDQRLGIFPVPGVTTRGLMKRRPYEGGVLRWSRGRVRLEVELPEAERNRVRALRIDVAAVAEGGARIWVRVNGRRRFAARVTRAPWSRTIPLNAEDLSSPLEIEIRSSAGKGGQRAELIALDGVWLASRPAQEIGRKSR